MCYTQRRRDNFPGTQFFLDKLLILKKGLGQGIPKQLVELKKVSEFFDGSLSPSENRPLGEKALSGQMLLELNFFYWSHTHTSPGQEKCEKNELTAIWQFWGLFS